MPRRAPRAGARAALLLALPAAAWAFHVRGSTAESDDTVMRLQDNGRLQENATVGLNESERDAANCAAFGLNPRWVGAPPPRVFDAFLYHGEDRLLSLRAAELRGSVDGHICGITEATFRGEPNNVPELVASVRRTESTAHVAQVPWGEAQEACKGYGSAAHMAFGLNLAFREDADRRHRSSCWQSFARNYLAKGVEEQGAQEEDWVIVSDVDEIPDRSAVQLLKHCDVPYEALLFRSHAHYIYSTRCKVTGGKTLWLDGSRGPVAVRVSTMRELGLQAARVNRLTCKPVGPYGTCHAPKKHVLPPSAWHMSSCMEPTGVLTKMQSNVDRITKSESVEDVMQFRKDCVDPRGFFQLERLAQPAMNYPDVPHAFAEDLQRQHDMMQ
mmetsp:Transcript_7349/g.22469  ORF Transcript_7349/g.22469 Transcript_7349/m.22469 type:complete len:385 (-) Transcript_7349:81-1235(-)